MEMTFDYFQPDIMTFNQILDFNIWLFDCFCKTIKNSNIEVQYLNFWLFYRKLARSLIVRPLSQPIVLQHVVANNIRTSRWLFAWFPSQTHISSLQAMKCTPWLILLFLTLAHGKTFKVFYNTFDPAVFNNTGDGGAHHNATGNGFVDSLSICIRFQVYPYCSSNQ